MIAIFFLKSIKQKSEKITISEKVEVKGKLVAIQYTQVAFSSGAARPSNIIINHRLDPLKAWLHAANVAVPKYKKKNSTGHSMGAWMKHA